MQNFKNKRIDWKFNIYIYYLDVNLFHRFYSVKYVIVQNAQNQSANLEILPKTNTE